MDLKNGHIMVTVGNIGVGYAKLTIPTSNDDGILSNSQIINFNEIEEL